MAAGELLSEDIVAFNNTISQDMECDVLAVLTVFIPQTRKALLLYERDAIDKF